MNFFKTPVLRSQLITELFCSELDRVGTMFNLLLDIGTSFEHLQVPTRDPLRKITVLHFPHVI